MTQFVTRIVTASTFALGVALAGETYAQASKDQLVGTWTLVSDTYTQDGQKHEPFGPNPKGIAIFGADGHFAIVITRADIPKFASGNREAGTPEENKAAVAGGIDSFGTYTVGSDGLTVHIDGSSFPNWRGITQKRAIVISGDELKWTNPTASTGAGSAEVAWKRVK